MTPESLSCPYCNSLVVLHRLPETSQHIRCPRCQELFPYRGETGNAPANGCGNGDGVVEGVLVQGGAAVETKTKGLSNRSLARIVLAVMALMAGITLIFAWNTTGSRRQRDYTPPVYGTVPAVAPAKLAGLGYLPADVNFIAGIHVAELADIPRSRRALEQIRADGTASLLQLAPLEQSTGIYFENVDHVVVGVQLLSLRVTVVAQMREPYDKGDILKALQRNFEYRQHRGTVYQFPVHGVPLLSEGYLWCADPRTLVFSSTRELKGIPDKRETSNTVPTSTGSPEQVAQPRFAEPIVKILTDQLSEGTPVWSVGYFDHWDQLGMLNNPLAKKSTGPAEPGPLDILAGIRSAAAWMRIENPNDVTYHLEARCTDATSAKKVYDYLPKLGLVEKTRPSFLERRAQAHNLSKDVGGSLKCERKDDRVTVEAKSSLDSLGRAVSNPMQPRAVSAQ